MLISSGSILVLLLERLSWPCNSCKGGTDVEEHWSGSVEIAASPETVYNYLADFPKHCEWAQTLDRMEQKQAPGPDGTGAVYKTYEVQAMHADRAPKGPLPTKGFKGTTQATVTELIPNKRVAWKAHPVPIKMGTSSRHRMELEPTANGGTKLTQTVDMTVGWLPGKVLSRLIFKSNPEE